VGGCGAWWLMMNSHQCGGDVLHCACACVSGFRARVWHVKAGIRSCTAELRTTNGHWTMGVTLAYSVQLLQNYSEWIGISGKSQLSVVLVCKVFKSTLQFRADYGTCLWTKNGYNSAETLLALICLQSIDRTHTDLSSDCLFDLAHFLEHLENILEVMQCQYTPFPAKFSAIYKKYIEARGA